MAGQPDAAEDVHGKDIIQSESGISRNGLGSKIPRLFTRMSASGPVE